MSGQLADESELIPMALFLFVLHINATSVQDGCTCSYLLSCKAEQFCLAKYMQHFQLPAAVGSTITITIGHSNFPGRVLSDKSTNVVFKSK